MRIHRTFSGTVRDAETLRASLRSAAGADAWWISKKEFFNCVRQNWISPKDWSGKVFLEIGWDESCEDAQILTSEILQSWHTEEILVARGSEPDLATWRDLAMHAVVPLHLVIRPREILNAGELAQKLEGLEDTRVSFEFIPWGPHPTQGYSVTDIRTLLGTFEQRLPGFRVKTLTGHDVLDRQSEPNLEI